MPAKSDEDRQLDHGSQGVLQSTVRTQPWWHGAGTGALGESTPKSSIELHNGSVANGAAHAQGNKLMFGWMVMELTSIKKCKLSH